MVMTPRVSKRDEVEDSSSGHVSTPKQRHDAAVDVLTEALWELWVRRQAQAPSSKGEAHTHG